MTEFSSQSFFLFLYKEKGITSQKCLTQFKRKYKIKKMGHHGTLDPFATGVLLVGVNEATRFFQYIDDSKKTYRAHLKLGIATDSLDETGEVLGHQDVPELGIDQIKSVLNEMLGSQMQTPPMFSAVKVNGQKLYELARKGQEIERKPRSIEVFDVQFLSYENQVIVFDVTVSRGTYIRVLAEDLAIKLGTVGHLIELSRTELSSQKDFQIYHLENELQQSDCLAADQLLNFESVSLDKESLQKLFYGQSFACDWANGIHKAYFQDCFVGLVLVEDAVAKVERLLSQQTLKNQLEF